MTMSPIDIFILIVCALLILRATIKGFVEEFGAVAAVLLGITAAVIFNGMVGGLLEQYLGPSMWNRIIAFLALFIVVYLIIKLSEAGLSRAIENAELENLDRALGFFMGIVEALVVSFILLFILYIQPLVDLNASLIESYSGRLFIPLFPYAAELITRGQA